MDWKQWELYWKTMIEFRNRYAAHSDEYRKPVPNFDIALKVVFYYDFWIRDVIAPDVFEEPPLTETAAQLQEDIKPLIEQLFETTMKHYRNVD